MSENSENKTQILDEFKTNYFCFSIKEGIDEERFFHSLFRDWISFIIEQHGGMANIDSILSKTYEIFNFSINQTSRIQNQINSLLSSKFLKETENRYEVTDRVKEKDEYFIRYKNEKQIIESLKKHHQKILNAEFTREQEVENKNISFSRLHDKLIIELSRCIAKNMLDKSQSPEQADEFYQILSNYIKEVQHREKHETVILRLFQESESIVSYLKNRVCEFLFLYYLQKKESITKFPDPSSINFYIKDNNVVIVQIISTMISVESIHKTSMDMITRSLLRDTYIKDTHYRELNRIENEKFRNQLLNQVNQEFLKIKTENEALKKEIQTITGEINSKAEASIGSIDEGIINYAKRKISRLNNELKDSYTFDLKTIKSFSLEIVFLFLAIAIPSVFYKLNYDILLLLPISVTLILVSISIVLMKWKNQKEKIKINKEAISELEEEKKIILSKIRPSDININVTGGQANIPINSNLNTNQKQEHYHGN